MNANKPKVSHFTLISVNKFIASVLMILQGAFKRADPSKREFLVKGQIFHIAPVFTPTSECLDVDLNVGANGHVGQD